MEFSTNVFAFIKAVKENVFNDRKLCIEYLNLKYLVNDSIKSSVAAL